jgi:hypothetical protein
MQKPLIIVQVQLISSVMWRSLKVGDLHVFVPLGPTADLRPVSDQPAHAINKSTSLIFIHQGEAPTN